MQTSRKPSSTHRMLGAGEAREAGGLLGQAGVGGLGQVRLRTPKYVSHGYSLFEVEVGANRGNLSYLFLPPPGQAEFPVGAAEMRRLVGEAFRDVVGREYMGRCSARYNGPTVTGMILAQNGSRRLTGIVSISILAPGAAERPMAERVMVTHLLGRLDAATRRVFEERGRSRAG